MQKLTWKKRIDCWYSERPSVQCWHPSYLRGCESVVKIPRTGRIFQPRNPMHVNRRFPDIFIMIERMDWKSFTSSCSRSVLFAETLWWAKWNVISNIFTTRAHRSTHINNFTNHQEHSGSGLRRWEYARRSSSRKSPGFPSSVLHKQYTSTFSFDVPMPAGRKAWMKALGLPHIRCLVSWPGVQMWPQADIESLSIWSFTDWAP